MSERTAPTPPGRARFGRAVLRRLPLAGTVLGLGLAVWLVATHDLGAVGHAFGRIGILGLAGVVLVRVAILLLCGLAWARLLARPSPAETGAFVLLRFVREGINTLLPVASVGGEVVGGRLLTFWGVRGPLAAASILVDMLMQAGTQALFVLLGVWLLLQMEGEAAAALAAWALRALLITVLLLAAFLAFQRSSAMRRIESALAALGRRLVQAAPETGAPAGPAPPGLHAALDRIWARGRGRPLAGAFVLHLLAWALGAAEIAIALACIGVEGVTLTEVVVIEALCQAIKSAAFPIPSGLGVQEGGFVLVGGLFGIDAGTAIALSLVKRVPVVVLGLPALLLWQSLEARRAAVLPPRA